MRTCREMGIKTVAVYSDADTQAVGLESFLLRLLLCTLHSSRCYSPFLSPLSLPLFLLTPFLSLVFLHPSSSLPLSPSPFLYFLPLYRRTGFNCENLIVSLSRVRKLLIRKLILLIPHPYVQFAQMQLLNSQCT